LIEPALGEKQKTLSFQQQRVGAEPVVIRILDMKTITPSKERLVGQKPAAASKLPRPQIRSVLVPIDFSQPSLTAIEMALPLIKRFGATLHFVHVFEPDYSLSSMTGIPLMVPEIDVGRRVRRRLQHLAESKSIPLRRENIHAIKGQPFEQICQLAREIEIDLIVMATRGNTGLKHLALGSTTERVVRYSPCPVLVVRGNYTERKPAPGITTFRKILVPVDFSDCSMKGLEYAKGMAPQLHAKLILLNSIALQYYVASDEYARYDFPRLVQQTDLAARQQMHDLVQETDWSGLEVKTSHRIGHAGAEICMQAKDDDVDLIVISTHGRTGFKHVFLGSTAEYVVRHASCPVLVVPAQARTLPNSLPHQDESMACNYLHRDVFRR
jgi:nucleotide-binding universal stress UspA family protein